MANKFISIELTKGVWESTIEHMLESEDPILIMTAKVIIDQIAFNQKADELRKKFLNK